MRSRPAGAPEYGVETDNGHVHTRSYTYFVAGDPGSEELAVSHLLIIDTILLTELKYMVRTVTTPLPSDSTRRLTIHTAAVTAGNVSTVLSFVDYTSSTLGKSPHTPVSSTTSESSQSSDSTYTSRPSHTSGLSHISWSSHTPSYSSSSRPTVPKSSQTKTHKSSSTIQTSKKVETTAVISNPHGRTVTEVFIETTYSKYSTVTGTTTVSISTEGTIVPVVIGPSGVGWNIPVVSSIAITPPLGLPPSTSHQASGTSLQLSNPPSGSIEPHSSKSSLPSGILVTTLTTENKAGSSITQAFTETTYSGYETITAATHITKTVDGTPVTVVIGISGLGWGIPVVSNSPVPPPLQLPSNASGAPKAGTSSTYNSSSSASKSSGTKTKSRTSINTGSASGTQPTLSSPLGGSTSSAAAGTTPLGVLVTYSIFPTATPSAITTGTTTYSTGGHLLGGIPVLAPKGPHCWFCPPGPPNILGWDLPGFKLPGIYPPGGPPADWPTPFPAITVGPNGDPTFESEPPKSEPSESEPSRSQTSKSQKSTTKSDSSTSKSETSCASSAVPKCTLDVSVFVPSGATTSTTTTKVSFS
jgi:hypothetical protein